ncbi:MAG TPA: hypothetical protein PLP34_07335 [Chitinophagaceae bacterium]|nr:hypothetical protein [Chitinophagaceae bacterium]HNF72207.1 hypothetical protein [Chitinophagaceae bacterium]
MQELIDQLVQQAGLSNEQAGKSVQVMLTFVKSKLPAPVAANLEAFLSGTKPETKEDQFKEKAEEFAEAAREKFEDLAGQAREKLGEAAEKAEEMAKETLEKLKGMWGNKKE